MVIVDTTVWIDYFNDVETIQTIWLDEQLAEERLGIVDLIACEILQGLSTEEEAVEVLGELEQFEIFETGGLGLATAATATSIRSRSTSAFRSFTLRPFDEAETSFRSWCPT